MAGSCPRLRQSWTITAARMRIHPCTYAHGHTSHVCLRRSGYDRSKNQHEAFRRDVRRCLGMNDDRHDNGGGGSSGTADGKRHALWILSSTSSNGRRIRNESVIIDTVATLVGSRRIL